MSDTQDGSHFNDSTARIVRTPYRFCLYIQFYTHLCCVCVGVWQAVRNSQDRLRLNRMWIGSSVCVQLQPVASSLVVVVMIYWWLQCLVWCLESVALRESELVNTVLRAHIVIWCRCCPLLLCALVVSSFLHPDLARSCVEPCSRPRRTSTPRGWHDVE